MVKDPSDATVAVVSMACIVPSSSLKNSQEAHALQRLLKKWLLTTTLGVVIDGQGSTSSGIGGFFSSLL
jgi:hypothetical protein